MSLINCPECEKEISDKATICPNCGLPCPATDLRETEREEALMEGLCNYVKNPLYAENGHGILTTKRFIFSKHSIAKTLAIGVFVNFTEGSYDFDIPMETITSVTRSRQGLSRNVFLISSNSGQNYKFAVTKFTKWEIAFNNALQSYGKAFG